MAFLSNVVYLNKLAFPYSAINKQMVQKKLVTSWFGGMEMVFGGTEMVLGVRKWFLGVRKWFGGTEMVFKWLQFHKFYSFNLTSFSFLLFRCFLLDFSCFTQESLLNKKKLIFLDFIVFQRYDEIANVRALSRILKLVMLKVPKK